MKRWIGLFCLLTWLPTPVLWWESRQPVPREIVQCDIGERLYGFFSEDGRLFLYGDEERVRIYDLLERHHVATLPRSIYYVVGGARQGDPLGFKRRDRIEQVDLASGKTIRSIADRIELVDLASGKTIRSFAAGPGKLDGVKLAPNHKVAAVDQNSGPLRLWDVDTGQVLLELACPAQLRAVHFSADSQRVAIMERSADQDHLKLIDIGTLEVTENANGAKHGVYYARFAPDGRLLGTAGIEESEDFELWDLTNDKLIFRTPHADWARFLADGAYCSVSYQPMSPLLSAIDWLDVDWLDVSPKSILRSGIGAEWRLFDMATGQLMCSFPLGKQGQIQLLPDGKTMATCSFDDDFIYLWDIPPRTAVHPFWLWATLALAVGLTAWWWRRQRKARASGSPPGSPVGTTDNSPPL